jgi:hypothetical protein
MSSITNNSYVSELWYSTSIAFVAPSKELSNNVASSTLALGSIGETAPAAAAAATLGAMVAALMAVFAAVMEAVVGVLGPLFAVVFVVEETAVEVSVIGVSTLATAPVVVPMLDPSNVVDESSSLVVRLVLLPSSATATVDAKLKVLSTGAIELASVFMLVILALLLVMLEATLCADCELIRTAGGADIADDVVGIALVAVALELPIEAADAAEDAEDTAAALRLLLLALFKNSANCGDAS